MADNVNLPGVSGSFTAGTDEVGGIHYQIVKLGFGANGTVSLVENEPARQSTLASLDSKSDAANTLLGQLDTKSSAANTLLGQIQTAANSINTKTPTLNTLTATLGTPAVPVKMAARRKFQPRFFKTIANLTNLNSQWFDIIETGVGQTISYNQGRLQILSSTTANQETILRSKESFKGEFNAKWSMALSQRIAGDRFFVELTDVVGDLLPCTVLSTTQVSITFPPGTFTAEDVGQSMWLGAFTGFAGVPQKAAIFAVSGDNVTFTVTGFPATGTGTCSVWGRNLYSVEYSGTSNSTAFFDLNTDGWALAPRSLTTQPTTAHQMCLGVTDFSVSLLDRVSDVTNSHTTRFHTDARMIAPDVNLYLQIRVINNPTPPATPTTFVLPTVEVAEYVSNRVDLASMGPMSTSYKLQTTIESGQCTLAQGSNLAGDFAQGYRSTAGGASATQVVSAASTNATVIRSSAARLIGWEFSNTTASWVYVCFHNSSAAPTAGTGVVRKIGIPPNGKSEFVIEGGNHFTTGIGMTIVSGAALTDATAVTANAVIGSVFWA